MFEQPNTGPLVRGWGGGMETKQSIRANIIWFDDGQTGLVWSDKLVWSEG